MSENLTFASISEIHDVLVRRLYPPKDLYQYLIDNYAAYYDPDSETETVDLIRGSETEYHNLSVEFSKQRCSTYAAVVADLGVKEYPLSTDLIADKIKFFQKIGDIEKCREGFEKLKDIDRKYWGWRTYVFAIDYLKDGLSSEKSVSDFEKNVELAKGFIEDFKVNIPHDERSYMAEAELYENQGEFDKAIAILREAVDTQKIAVAPQCCLKLADMMLERGQYSEVEKYARKGILMATEEQPSVSVAYLYYLLALAMDAHRIKARQDGNLVEDVQIQKIAKAFQTADRLFLNEGRETVSYRRTIRAKLIVLEMEEGILVNIDSHAVNEENQSEKQPSLADLVRLQKLLEDN